MADNKKLKIGITQGDINGIGYEVIMKALEDEAILELCTPVIYGSAKIAAFYRKALELPALPLNQVQQASEARDEHYNIINVVGEDTKVEPGQATRTAGEAAMTALERAVADLKAGDIDVLVTAPINKHEMQSDTFRFPGHTEYLESSLGEPGEKALMVMCSEAPALRVALLTTHTPMARVAQTVTQEAVEEKIKALDSSLRRDFGIVRPRIAVLALNPHAGEQGMLGTEEQTAIIPAIESVRKERIEAFGPYAADGFFGNGLFSRFDGVLAMYHDQGLAPFKTIAMDRGVNLTAGLPYVRTSPDHGTGFDIAGQGKADPESMLHAIYAAIDIYRNRINYASARRNPLRKQYFDKSKDNVVLDLTKDDTPND